MDNSGNTLKDKEPSKPVKNKRRTSKESLDSTPTGPSAKKQKTNNTRTRKLSSKLEGSNQKETEADKENTELLSTSVSEESNKEEFKSKSVFSPKITGKPKVAVCKDVTSRGKTL